MHRMTQMMVAGSAFDNLGMPTIRPRGSTGEEKRAEETPAVTEVAPASKINDMVNGLLIDDDDFQRNWRCLISFQTNRCARCRSSSR